MSIKHFIATRFNLKIEEWNTAKDGSVVLTEKWLEERFNLFEKYCFPSVANQSIKNFYWLIFFDVRTPDIFKKRIEKYTNDFQNFKVIYIDGIKSLKYSFKQIIMESLEEDDDFIITSRLDNDDSIHHDFVYIIQNLAIKKHETIIDLRRGYQLDISSNIYEYRNYYNKFNPFISLVESTSNFQTVFSRMHHEWKNATSVIVNSNLPLWIEIVHKRNKFNRANFNLPLIRNINLEDFSIKKEYKLRNPIYILTNNLKVKILNVLKNLKYKLKYILKKIIQLFS